MIKDLSALIIKRKLLWILGLMFLFSGPAFAINYNTPEGVWRTHDNHDVARSIVRVFIVKGGEMRGKVLDVLPDGGGKRTDRCIDCSGENKGKLQIGIITVWGLHREGDEWVGGHILDPYTGNVYNCKMKLVKNGRQMRVQAYLGIPLFGATMHWRKIR